MSYQLPIKTIMDLGLDISGLQAIVTQPEHRHLYPEGPTVVTLKSVTTRREKYTGTSGPHRWFQWVRLEYQAPAGSMLCNYSGWREDAFADHNPIVELL